MTLFERNGWGFHHDVASNYGQVVKLHGLYGVCCVLELHFIVNSMIADVSADKVPLRVRPRCDAPHHY